MLIDVLFLLVMAVAVFKGLRKGFIIGLFSIFGFVIGLAAALKLSASVAGWLDNTTNISARWLPLVSFLLVFILVTWLVQLGAALISKTAEAAMLGPINRVAGAVLYIVLYVIIFSVFLFFLQKMELVKGDTVSNSVVYPYVQPVAPIVIDALGAIIPFFSDLFHQLESFFEKMQDKVPDGKSTWLPAFDGMRSC